MSEENVQIMRGVFDAWARGEFGAAVLSHLDEHVLYVVPPDFPEFGVFVGPDGFAEFMRRFLAQWERLTIEAQHVEAIAAYTRGLLETWEDFTMEAEELVAAGDSVLAGVHQRGMGRTSGVPTEMRYFTVWSFRGRKVIHLESFRERAAALKAAGLSE